MLRTIAALAVVCGASAAHANTIEEAKAKPAKYVWEASVDTETAIACLLTDNSFNVQTIRKDGYVDMPMYYMGHRTLLVTIIQQGEGVRIEARGQMARAAMRAKPCMGMPAEKRLPPLG